MTLEDELRWSINASQGNAWHTFESIRKAPRAFGLTPAKVKKWKTPGEPAFVSKLLDERFIEYYLPCAIGHFLRPIGLCEGDPLVSGVFMHQKPKVKFSRCHIELADLLFVRHHFVIGNSSEPVQARAFLLQAKAGANPYTGTLKDKEAEQFRLYSDWNTPLTFPNGELNVPADGSAKWNFGKGPMPHSHQSGIYGLVFNEKPQKLAGFPDDCAWAVGQAIKGSNAVSGSSSLSSHFADFIRGSAGRPWTETPSTDDHWSQFIIHCLKAAVGWRYPVQRLGQTDQPRLRQALAFARAFDILQRPADAVSMAGGNALYSDVARNLLANFTDYFPQGPIRPGGDQTDQAFSGGVSVLYVATSGHKPLDEIHPRFNDQQG